MRNTFKFMNIEYDLNILLEVKYLTHKSIYF